MTAQSHPSDTHQSSIPLEHAYLDEHRESTRFERDPGMDYASIVSPESLVGSVEVADESLGGMGLVVDDRGPFAIDQVIELSYSGSLYRAQVRHITRRDDGRFIVGLLCSAK